MLVFSEGKISIDLKCRADNKEEVRQLFFRTTGENIGGDFFE